MQNFLDHDGVMYRRQSHDKHQLVVPKVLIYAVIKAKHDPVYIVHPGMKRTFNFLWLVVTQYAGVHRRLCHEMRRTSEAEGQRIRSPARRSGGTKSPFPGHIHAYNRPTFDGLCRNQYLLTFIDCITEIVEAKMTLTLVCEITLKGSAPLG